ncbi:hypothetical protein BKI52_08840 [marine bacterium AO1-C]|nr:hypothetical protein BKI52_08840 [marine bacterium AO1-C]
MATIINLLTKASIYLHIQHTLGRGSDNTTKINIPDVSSRHATIFWQDNQWFLKDHSLNGTLVNKKFTHQKTVKLSQGSVIKFGRDFSSEYKVTDLKPPKSYLVSLNSSQQFILEKDYYALPDKKNPTISLTLVDNIWQLEKNGETYLLDDRQTFEVAQQRWMFVKNDLTEDTIDYGKLRNKAWFLFTVSTDQERVRVQIEMGENSMDLGVRAYNPMLLTLARKRLEDIEARYPPKDQGWMMMEQLTAMLSKEELKEVDQYHVNVRIHRIKEQLLKLQPYGSQFVSIIERRKGEIRFNHDKIKISD